MNKNPGGRRKGMYEKQLATANEHGCRLWLGRLDKNGYGKYGNTRRASGKAHAEAYVEAHRPIQKGLEIRHMCAGHYPAGDFTYRRCCTVEHLTIGTRLENAHDMVNDNRTRKGAAHYRTKLSDEHLLLVCAMRLAGRTQACIARLFGVSDTLVRFITQGGPWEPVGGRLPNHSKRFRV